MKSFRVGLVLVLVAATGGRLLAQGVPEDFLGHWNPFSRNVVGLLGDIDVSQSSVRFSRAGIGETSAKVLETSESSVLLELEDAAYCGRFLRLGPIRMDPLNAGTKQVRVLVAIFKTRADVATMPLVFDPLGYEGAKYCTWGFYER